MQHKLFLKQYFQAINTHNVDAILEHFSEAAVVYYEGAEYRGPDNIRHWLENANKQYNACHTVLNISFTDNEATAIVSVAGTFSGSPIQQTFYFIVEDYKITSLKCGT